MDPLSRKLVFGDEEQIAAINALVAEQKNEAEEKEKLLSGELSWFEVELRFDGTYVVKVLASDMENAKEKAIDVGVDLMVADVDDVEAWNAWPIKAPLPEPLGKKQTSLLQQ